MKIGEIIGGNQMNKMNYTANEMNQTELFKTAFYYLNSFKRHRALANINRRQGEFEKAKQNELSTYQYIDSLELALRALQKGHRDLTLLDAEDDEQ